MPSISQEKFYTALDQMFGRGQEYSADVLLSVADTPHTRYIGWFMHSDITGMFVPEGESISATWEHPRQAILEADVIIAAPNESRPFQPVEAARKIATCLCMARKIPEGHIVVCADARTVQGKPDPFGISKINVLYDESGASKTKPKFTAADIEFNKKGALVWHGELPECVAGFCKNRNERLRGERMADEIASMFDGIAHISHHANDNMLSLFYGNTRFSETRSLVSAVSFGQLQVELGTDSSKKTSYIMQTLDDQAADWLIDNVVFTQRGLLDTIGKLDAEDENTLSQLRDVATIWRACLTGYGVSLGCDNKLDVGAIQKLGCLIGADSMIEAYFGGVPVADILA